ncbi:NAD(P)H-dependent oxidoreductase [Roseicyclus marinus]|uniref:NAD(P)H-dependent oxidoreductase n=1 Tax=Roseicyclus marinus TaxID=2161673 RepID=UPI00240F2868|nr:NAD(P)H-dependent oxidoreductase [Roseicyclus marinus]MDG3039772.1 NAD(P)H-dependent oxidoreductase [Roseicyclus marinus]
MARIIQYFAHPGVSASRINAALWRTTEGVDGITRVDLYAAYPRYDIDIDAEQQRLRDHDVIVLQFPLFWYSCPALVKEWIDLVWEHGFAYGQGGTALRGKTLLLAISAGGPQDAYRPDGYQHHDLRSFLTPFEQTARLSGMDFLPPYVLYGALRADPAAHATGFARLLAALRDDRLDRDAAMGLPILTHDTLPIAEA